MDANKRRERATAEAAQWWLRFEEGELSRENREELVDWLRESPLHVAELLRMAEVHSALEQFKEWTDVSTLGWDKADSVIEMPLARTAAAPVQLERPRRRPARKVWWLGGAVAAALIAGVAVWFAFALRAEVIETGRGDRRGVTLADGSVIQIDPESRLRIRLERDSRHVNLERGRALFRVAKDPLRPFYVDADSTVVRAVGTQFGVEQASEGVVVTVAEGKVAVTPAETRATIKRAQNPESTDTPAERGTASSEVFLIAGQQVTVPKQGPAHPVKPVDTERELAWAAGRLVFENQSVAGVIEEFNRYNVIQLHVSDEQLAHRAVSGVFDASEPESFIGFMQSVVPVRVTRSGQEITIASAP